MENRELLHFILGYLYEINKKEKIKSKKLKRINKFIEEFERKPIVNNEDFENNYESHNDYDNLMDGYDYDNDSDQQDPNFW